jgi:hypothetical protein
MDMQIVSTLALIAVSGGAGVMMAAMVAHGTISSLRDKLNGARNDLLKRAGEIRELNQECGTLRAQIEADAKFVDLGKRRAAARARENAKDRAERAAKKAGRAS